MAQVFLSYADDGLEAASYLKRAIEKRRLSVFLAKQDIAPFSDWEAAIEINLKDMQVFVPVWTDGYEASRWAIMESTYAWFSRESVSIAPVMLGEKPPDHPTNRIQACTVENVPDLPPLPSPPDGYEGLKLPDHYWQRWASDVADLIVERMAERN